MGVGESLRIEVPNTRQGLAPATVQAEAWLAARQASSRVTYWALLAMEELVMNCIEHGFDDAREHTIAIELSMADSALTMTVIDDGPAFNPLTAATPDLGVELEKRLVGGLGIHMLRKLSDGMEYERRQGTNRLTLSKRMEHGTTAPEGTPPNPPAP